MTQINQAPGTIRALSPTAQLAQKGQSIWLDDISRDLLDGGTLANYIAERSVTGLTSNPSTFDHAISGSTSYDTEIARLAGTGLADEAIFFELAIQDLSRAAELLLPVHRRSATVDGWVSLEVSPLLARDADGSIAAARSLHDKAHLPNLFIKIPGTPEGLPAIEEAIFQGVPVNVTLLFSPDHYTAAATAYLKGLERRVEKGLSPDVRSVASIFVSRWDRAIADSVSDGLKNRLGLAIGQLTYQSYREFLDSDRWQRLENLGARPQRLLFASTGTKDPNASDLLYIENLAAPNTINTMPEATLDALADHGRNSQSLRCDGHDSGTLLREYEKEGISIAALAEKLQRDGADAFVTSWRSLLKAIGSKRNRQAA